jgi:serine O-acetyltransferase
LRDGVIIASGAQIIGPITIGKCSRVGANSVVLKDVPDNTTVVGVPARAVKGPKKDQLDERFAAYGVGNHDLPDPVFKVMDGLLDKVQSLSMRVEELENERRAEAETPIPLKPKKKPTARAASKAKTDT